jgi:hypothetical protein
MGMLVAMGWFRKTWTNAPMKDLDHLFGVWPWRTLISRQPRSKLNSKIPEQGGKNGQGEGLAKN